MTVSGRFLQGQRKYRSLVGRTPHKTNTKAKKAVDRSADAAVLAGAVRQKVIS